MNIRKIVLSAFIASLMAFQSVSVCTGNAQVSTAFESTFKTEKQDKSSPDLSFLYDEEEGGYFIGIGLRDVEYTVPVDYKAMDVKKLDLGHVYAAVTEKEPLLTDTVVLNIPEEVEVVNKHWKCMVTGIPHITLVYPSGEKEELKADDYQEMREYTIKEVNDETIPEEGIDRLMFIYAASHYKREDTAYPSVMPNPYYENSYISYKGADGKNYLKILVGLGQNEITIPEEYDGYKINNVKLSEIIYAPDVAEKDSISLTVHVPDSVLISDTEWIDNDTNIDDITLIDSSGYKMQFEAMAYMPQDIRVYNCSSNAYYNAVNLDLDRINFMYDHNYIYDKTNVFADVVTIRVMDNLKINQEHWLAAKTHVLQIKLVYPDGKEVLYKADDYNEYTKESGKYSEYNRLISGGAVRDSFTLLGENALNDKTLWLVTDFEDVNDMPDLKDTDKVIVEHLGTWDKNQNIKELIFPDNLKRLGIKHDAFLNIIADKLVLPPCPTTVEEGTFKASAIKEVVFSGDVEIPHMSFYRNPYLEEVTFKGDADIAYSAFWECSSLKNVNISTDQSISGETFNDCPELMTINGESPVNDDGSLKPEYEDFIKSNFKKANNIGFINKYVMYCVKKTVAETVTEDMSDMEKVKAIHDKLCSMTSYDTKTVEDKKNHVDGSVFLNDQTVCEGYALALNLLLHEAGVDSCYVETDDHAWVIVRLGDHYFHVDPTWDDGDEVNYDWFLKADSEVTDEASHKGHVMECPSPLHKYKWETMPACSEKMGDVNGDDIVDGRDATSILTAYAKSSLGTELEVDQILADYDFNGIIDARDASAVLTAYIRDSVGNE